MTLPNKGTRKPKITKRTSKRSKPEIILVMCLCLLACIYVSVFKTLELVGHDETVKREEQAHAPVRKVSAGPLAHEDIFLNTLKSCLPQDKKKKCKTFIPPDSQTERVALMAPPGDMTDSFFRLLEVVVGRAKRKSTVKIELIPISSMAPYGYGKTHGWTRIIRLVPQPLILGVTNTLQSSLIHGQSPTDITMNDVKANLRQQIRYHCRLSHVAAHTALWTLTLQDLANDSLSDLIGKSQSFLGLEHDNFLNDMEGGNDDLVPPEDIQAFVDTMYSYGSSMLTTIQAISQENLMKLMDDVLMEELRISKNLTAWPCQSFWTVGEGQDKLRLSPMLSRVAKAISPNCTAAFTSCFVKRDLCESKGDGPCK